MLPTIAPCADTEAVSTAESVSVPRARRLRPLPHSTRLDQLLRLRAHVDAEITRTRAQLALTARSDDETRRQPPGPALEQDLAQVAEVLYVRVEHLRCRSRHRGLARRRHLAAWLLRQLGYSLPRIGLALERDHSTILSSVRVVENDPQLRDRATTLLDRVQAAR